MAKPLKKPKQKTYQKYDVIKLDAAVAAVQANRMSQRKAAKQYGVPPSTISDRLTGYSHGDVKPGRPQVIPFKIEEEVVSQVIKGAEQGFGTTRVQLMQKRGRVVKAMKLKTPFRNQTPGKQWFLNLKRRHTSVTLRKPERTTTTRMRGMNSTLCGNYFEDLLAILKESGLEGKPQCVWNMDESGVRFEHDPSLVLAGKGSKQVPARTSNSRKSATLIVGGNAAGRALSPLIIMKGKTERALMGVNVAEGPIGAKYTYQANAWTENVLGVEWFERVFLAECGADRPQLLLLDGHKSHESLGMLQLVKNQNILVLCLACPHD